MSVMAVHGAMTPGSRAPSVSYVTSSSLRASNIQSALRQKKALLLDQFGVLHDGQRLYPGVRDAVEYLHKELGLRILVVSNSSRRSDGALRSLEAKGVNIEWIEDIITSGEVTASVLTASPRDEPFRGLRRCLHFTWGARGAISLDGLGIEVVGRDVDSADFILAHGTEAIATSDGPSSCSLDDMKGLLEKAAGLPMIVANPDCVTVDGPQLVTMPGTLAKYYEDIGGTVYRMGKPDRRIYAEALRMLQLDASEVMAVGDSMEHDIAGAAKMGIDSIFIAGGIHKDAAMTAVGGEEGSMGAIDKINEAGIDALCTEFACRPTYVMTWFR